MSLLQGNVTDLLRVLAFAQKFHDFPKNFVPPSLGNPHYVPPYTGTRVIAVAYPMIVLSTIVIIARLSARLFTGLRKWGADDWTILFATIFTIGYTVVQALPVHQGCVGRHVYDSTWHDIRYSFRFEFAGPMVYLIANQLLKISILLFIQRLSPKGDLLLRRLIIGTHVVIGIQFVGLFLTTMFGCAPVRAVWDIDVRMDPNTKCISIWGSLVAWAIIYALTDLWLVLLPMRIVWGLQMPKATRVGILIVFGCGFIATIAAIAKAAVMRKAYDTFDPCWNFGPVLIWSELEMTFGLIGASLPALNTWLIKLVPSSLKNSSLLQDSKRTVPKDSKASRMGPMKQFSSEPTLITTSTVVTTEHTPAKMEKHMDLEMYDYEIQAGGMDDNSARVSAILEKLSYRGARADPPRISIPEIRSHSFRLDEFIPRGPDSGKTLAEPEARAIVDDAESAFSVELVLQKP